MFGFFLQTGQTFKLPSHAGLLKDYPQMCSTGSDKRPDLIPNRSQVIPCLTKNINSKNIPLFVPMRMQNNHLEPAKLQSKQRFYLMFYPDPTQPPQANPLIQEYWKSIQPMIICRDMSGYYLGTLEDSHKMSFEICHSTEPKMTAPSICQAISNYDENLAYGNPAFSDKHIYLDKHSTK